MLCLSFNQFQLAIIPLKFTLPILCQVTIWPAKFVICFLWEWASVLEDEHDSQMWQRQIPESPPILPSFSKWDNLTMFSNEEGKTVLQRAHIYYWGNHQIILDAGIWYQRLNRNLSVGTNIQYLWGYRLF